MAKQKYTFKEATTAIKNLGLEKEYILILFDREEGLDTVSYKKKTRFDDLVVYLEKEKYEEEEGKFLMSLMNFSNILFKQLFVEWNSNDSRFVKSHSFIVFINIVNYPDLPKDSRDMGVIKID